MSVDETSPDYLTMLDLPAKYSSTPACSAMEINILDWCQESNKILSSNSIPKALGVAGPLCPKPPLQTTCKSHFKNMNPHPPWPTKIDKQRLTWPFY